MNLSCHVNSFLNSVCYRIGDVLVDPGDVWIGFSGVKSVLLTHAHFDHIYGLNELVKLSPDVKVYTNNHGKEMLLNAKRNLSFYHDNTFVFRWLERIVVVENGDIVDLGNGLRAEAIFTPGHNPSCVTWVVGDVVFTGDSYIPGIKTVTNLPGGNKIQANESEAIIQRMSYGRIIYSGHNLSK